MWCDVVTAAAATGPALGWEVELSEATQALAPEELSDPERIQFAGLGAGPRAREWMLGRSALKALIGGGDTSKIRFPSARYSLTHAGGRAVAARAMSFSGAGPGGLGVDFEAWRLTDGRMARYFLHPCESGHLTLRPGDELLRLWTVKEALFKALIDNRAAGATLLDFCLESPVALVGEARGPSGRRFRYISDFTDHGPLCVAISVATGTRVLRTTPVAGGGDPNPAAAFESSSTATRF